MLRERVVTLLAERPESFEVGGKARAVCDEFRAAAATAYATMERLGQLAGVTDPIQALTSGSSWVEETVEKVLRWKAHLHQAPTWTNWKSAVAKAKEAGLGSLVAGLERGEFGRDELDRAFEVAYARWWIDRVVTEDPALRGFIVARHEDNIARFRAADARVGEIAKQIVRARLGGDVPSPTAFGSDPEWGTLARELTKKARHMPLRKLFAQIPTALTRLTPCVMMSPLSIAQYLPADAQPFDVVLFDEASQIPVWDAIGAIARGKQVVVVGDPQQLPPTSFGERGVDEVEDGTDVTDQESILDECLAANIPSRRLDWHYRSRHESLIAFSNHAYYTGQLVTFPSPVTEDRAVRYVHVPGGVYERGTGRVNREEARAVVADVVRRLKAPDFAADRRSIGIVTFNGEQQRLIENLLDQERRSHPELEPFFDPARWHEPVFVKNLENVQGDERDVILFSVAVGPDETGPRLGHRQLAQPRRRPSAAQRGDHPRPSRARRLRHAAPGADRPLPDQRPRRARLQALPRVRRARRQGDRGGLRPDRPSHRIAVRGRGQGSAREQGLGGASPGRRLRLPRRPRRRPSRRPGPLPGRRGMRRGHLPPLAPRRAIATGCARWC